MEEIKVGEYVRSLVNGSISKVLEVSDLIDEPNIKYYKTGKFTGFCSTENYNVKHSPNIIDLVQKGDYIQLEDRGERFYEVTTDYQGKLAIIDIGWNEYEEIDETYNQDIKSIVTHEQFNQVKYEV